MKILWPAINTVGKTNQYTMKMGYISRFPRASQTIHALVDLQNLLPTKDHLFVQIPPILKYLLCHFEFLLEGIRGDQPSLILKS